MGFQGKGVVRESARPVLLDAALAVIAFGLCAHPSVAGDVEPCPYTVTQAGAAPNCGFWGPALLQPEGLNKLGHWVGYRNSCPDNLWEIPIKWTPEGGLTSIPIPPETNRCWAYGINDLGAVVGVRSGVADGQFHGNWACVWLPGGQFIEIPPLGGSPPESAAIAVNNSNVVVGWRKGVIGRYAFSWSKGEVTDLIPAEFGFATAEARDISDSGFIVGQFGADSTGTGRAFRWKDGEVEILQPLPGAVTSDARAVSNAGIAFGQCRFLTESGFKYRAAMWGFDGVPVELPPLEGYTSWGCHAANDAGVILGSVALPTRSGLPSSQQVIWLDGVVYPIRSLIDSPNPSQFGETRDLNEFGEILGRGHVPPTGAGGTWILNPTGSIADLDGDCEVNGADLAILLAEWGVVADASASADINGDGIVDGNDLAIVLGHWTGS